MATPGFPTPGCCWNYDIEKWLANLCQLIEMVKSQHQTHIYYLAKDVPFIYPLQFPELAAFKDFFRRRFLLPPNQTRGEKFSVSEIGTEFSKTANRIVSIYNTIPSTEIWSSESFNSILKQIQFYHYTGQFESSKDAQSLFDIIEVMINHLELQAETGVKYTFGEKPEKDASAYNLYNNELFIGEDTILADMGSSRLTLLNHSFINYMTTTDEAFGNYTFTAIKNIISRSTPVSWAGEKGIKIFFNGLKRKLSEARSLK